MFDNLDKHPSYGMIGFSRTSVQQGSLYGSSIQHKDIIRMTLKHSSLGRELNEDYYFGNGTIAEVDMSYSQFAELITSMNVGDGIPCTIRFTEKDGHIPETPFESKYQQFEREFSNQMEDIRHIVDDAIKETKEIFEKKSVGKGDKEVILNMLKSLSREIGSNTDFIYRQFNEQMEKTVTEAKGEVEAFCQNKMHSIAVAALAENPQFSEEGNVMIPDYNNAKINVY